MTKQEHVLAFAVVLSLAQGYEVHDFNASSKSYIVNQHNEYRSTRLDQNYPASNMKKLKWSNRMANKAKEWANALGEKEICDRGLNAGDHGPKGFTWGQNMAGNSYTYSKLSPGIRIAKTIDTFMKGFGIREQSYMVPPAAKRYERDGETRFGRGIFDHYSQTVWALTSEIGCAYVETCNNKKRLSVCNYFPSGNIAGQEWYKVGKACSACGKGYRCEKKLCVRVGRNQNGNGPVLSSNDVSLLLFDDTDIDASTVAPDMGPTTASEKCTVTSHDTVKLTEEMTGSPNVFITEAVAQMTPLGKLSKNP